MRCKTERAICGTCQYWTGAREPVFDSKGNPKVDIFDNCGNCECTQSSKYEQNRKNDGKCKCYFKWTEIL